MELDRDVEGKRKRSFSAAGLIDAVDSPVFSARCKTAAEEVIRKLEEEQILRKRSIEMNKKKMKEINSCLSHTYRKASIMDAKEQQANISQEIQDWRNKTAGKVWDTKITDCVLFKVVKKKQSKHRLPEDLLKLRIVMFEKIFTDLKSKEESRLIFIKEVFGRVGKRIGTNNPLFPKKKEWYHELFNEIRRTAPEVHISVYASADKKYFNYPFNFFFYETVSNLMQKYMFNYYHGARVGFDIFSTTGNNPAFYEANVNYIEEKGIFKLFRNSKSTVEFLKKVQNMLMNGEIREGKPKPMIVTGIEVDEGGRATNLPHQLDANWERIDNNAKEGGPIVGNLFREDIKKVAVSLGMEDANAIQTLEDLQEYMAPDGAFEKMYNQRKEVAERNGKTFDANTENLFKQTFLNSVGLFDQLRTKFLFGQIPGFFHEIKRPIDSGSYDTLNGNSDEKQKEISESFPKKEKGDYVTGIFVLVPNILLAELCRGARTRKGLRTGNKTVGIEHQNFLGDTRYIVDLVTNQVIDTRSHKVHNKKSSKQTMAGTTVAMEEMDNEAICLVAPNPRTWYCSPDNPEFKKFSELFSRSIRVCSSYVGLDGDMHCIVNTFTNNSSLETERFTIKNHRFVCRVAYQLGIDPNKSGIVLDYIKSLHRPSNDNDITLLPLDQAFPYEGLSDYQEQEKCADQTGTAECSDFDHCVGRFFIFMNSIFFGMGTHHQVNGQRISIRKDAGEWCFYFWYRKYFGGN